MQLTASIFHTKTVFGFYTRVSDFIWENKTSSSLNILFKSLKTKKSNLTTYYAIYFSGLLTISDVCKFGPQTLRVELQNFAGATAFAEYT